MEVVDMTYKDNNTLLMIARQSAALLMAYHQSTGVTDVLRAYPMETTKNMAQMMFMVGYIEGKRAERARRKRK